MNPLTPSGLASSVIASTDVIFNDSLHAGILLDFSTKHEISKNSLTKLTKTQAVYPSSVELTIERIETMLAFVTLIFTDKNDLTQGLKHLLTLCKSNKTLLRTKRYLDKLFIPKFLFFIDHRVNKWLSECSRVEMVENTCIDFATIVTDIKLNRFYCDLPSSIRLLSNERTVDSRNDQATNKKRKSSLESSSSKIVTNNTVEIDWKLKHGES